MLPGTSDSSIQTIQKPLIIINKLILKAMNAKSRENLKFVILNDTLHIVNYDRAVLFELEGNKAKLIGISGQVQVKSGGALQEDWKHLVNALIDNKKPQRLVDDSFRQEALPLWKKYQEHTHPILFWLPLQHEGKAELGLLLEIWPASEKPLPSLETMEAVNSLLLPAYALCWEKMSPLKITHYIPFNRAQWLLFGLAILLSLFIIRVPLRVVAPAEIEPKDPYIIAAPLEGIIDQIVVKPGEIVKKEAPLIEYDRRVPEQELKVAQKEVEISQAEVNRAMTLGLKDKQALSQLQGLQLKLDKAKVNLGLAEFHASQLVVKAPADGVIMLDSPEEWRGKPVRVGEKILALSDPAKTKVRIWIPENDNIVLNSQKPIKVYLNIRPETGYEAKINYIGNESIVTEKHVPSFIAEADWVEQPPDIKLGLKGTAILYGDRVSLFYYIIRRPLSAIRHLIGW